MRFPRFRIPQPKSKVGKIIRAVLPLVLIAVGIYVAYNFPAIKSNLAYTFNKPPKGDPQQYPTFVKGGGAPAVGGVNIPIGNRQQCGKPLEYDKDGNPKLICDDYIYIPSIRVAAPLVNSTNPDTNAINNDLLRGVVHYPGTAWPGEQGNVFLTGHSSYYAWAKSDYKTVFTLVPRLTGGDLIVVYHKGIRYTYKVAEGFEVTPSQTDVLKPTPTPTLTLSTCVPIGTAYRRHIIRAAQVDPDPNRNKAVAPQQAAPTRLPGNR